MPTPLTVRPPSSIVKPDLVDNVNRSHPQAQGLVWCVAPGMNGAPELMAGTPPLWGANGSLQRTAEGMAVASSGFGGDVMSWPATKIAPRSYTGLTIVMRCIIDSLTTLNYNWLLSVPYSATTWAAPFNIGFGLSLNTNTAHWTSSDLGSTQMYTDGTVNPWHLADGKIHQYVAAFDNVGVTFYRDGVYSSGPHSIWFGIAEPVLWNPVGPSIFDRASYSHGEGVQGRMTFVGVWGRLKSAAEIRDLALRPYSFL